MPLELRLKAAGELRKKAGPEGRGQEGLRDRSRGREGRWPFWGMGGRSQLTAAVAGHSVRQVILVFLFFRDENSVVFKWLQN